MNQDGEYLNACPINLQASRMVHQHMENELQMKGVALRGTFSRSYSIPLYILICVI